MAPCSIYRVDVTYRDEQFCRARDFYLHLWDEVQADRSLRDGIERLKQDHKARRFGARVVDMPVYHFMNVMLSNKRPVDMYTVSDLPRLWPEFPARLPPDWVDRFRLAWESTGKTSKGSFIAEWNAGSSYKLSNDSQRRDGSAHLGWSGGILGVLLVEDLTRFIVMLDLHEVPDGLKGQLQVAAGFCEAAANWGLPEVGLIHGRGQGKLGSAVTRMVLDKDEWPWARGCSRWRTGHSMNHGTLWNEGRMVIALNAGAPFQDRLPAGLAHIESEHIFLSRSL